MNRVFLSSITRYFTKVSLIYASELQFSRITEMWQLVSVEKTNYLPLTSWPIKFNWSFLYFFHDFFFFLFLWTAAGAYCLFVYSLTPARVPQFSGSPKTLGTFNAFCRHFWMGDRQMSVLIKWGGFFSPCTSCVPPVSISTQFVHSPIDETEKPRRRQIMANDARRLRKVPHKFTSLMKW